LGQLQQPISSILNKLWAYYSELPVWVMLNTRYWMKVWKPRGYSNETDLPPHGGNRWTVRCTHRLLSSVLANKHSYSAHIPTCKIVCAHQHILCIDYAAHINTSIMPQGGSSEVWTEVTTQITE